MVKLAVLEVARPVYLTHPLVPFWQPLEVLAATTETILHQDLLAVLADQPTIMHHPYQIKSHLEPAVEAEVAQVQPALVVMVVQDQAPRLLAKAVLVAMEFP